ncbi:sigma-70 family RNA polymerase sigma factor [Persicimonas caeni]|uniref:Sigma-70 family RNA polymerase sigma factor n=1 Tax=Persicimonas caeni TaxID=2292766 RepID=A0A4Y6PQW7_PERCE|nr:sigma-70 family RNA polymerase sigma factor [Persicimonas caeni]QDG50175.1 sigma-70 family RNA polymerase sigma factor [Persicimonas caeni]QED31396.1 sigma-70 family RNA polymerase sigma factor [Persicimonas caeni]
MSEASYNEPSRDAYEDALPDGGTHKQDDDACQHALLEAKKLWSSVKISADTDPLSAYLNRLNHLEPLPSETQQELAVRYMENDDEEAAKLLVLTNLRLVVKLAKEYQRRKTDLLELIQQGNLGLSEALTRYDPYRGVKFTSYAQYWIRAMILNYLMNYTHPVRIGGSRAGRKLFYNLKKARRALMQNGHKPTASRVAQYLDVKEEEVVRVAAQLDAPPVYLDAEAPGHEDTTVGELMESETVSPESAAAEYDLASQIRAVIDEFGDGISDERKQAIWTERMIADDSKTLAELGDDWGVSKERIRQIEVGMREDFRAFLVERLGDDVKLEWLKSP